MIAIKIAGLPQHGLLTRIVKLRPPQISECIGIDAPARVGACRFLDIRFAVVPFAQREQLHHLAREILVGAAFAAVRTIEIDQHGRIFGHRVQHVAKIAERVVAQQYVLLIHQLWAPDLVLPGGEMVMPEQGHALGQRRRRHDHFAHPPGSQFLVAFSAQTLTVAYLVGRVFISLFPTCGGFAHPIRRRGHGLRQRAREQPIDRLLPA